MTKAVPVAPSPRVHPKTTTPNWYVGLASGSQQDALKMLSSYGSSIKQGQHISLCSLMSYFAGMAAGRNIGRKAFPLPPGCGKTTSIVAFVCRAYKMGLLGTEFTLAVATSKVEELCVIYKKLLKEGLPEDLVSLVHTLPVATKAKHRDTNGQPKKGYASIPATELPNGGYDYGRPVVLVTHARVETADDFASPLTDKTFVIWDENMVSTEGMAIKLKDLSMGLKLISEAIKEGTPELEQAYRFLRSCYDEIDKEYQRQKDNEEDCKRVLRFSSPTLSTDNLRKAILVVRPEGYAKALHSWVRFVDNLEKDTAVHLTPRPCLVFVDVVIPDSLQSVMILDGTASIDGLMLLDTSIEVLDLPLPPVVYSETQVFRIPHSASYDAVNKSISTAPFVKEVLGVLNRHQGEHILLYTFLEREKGVVHEAILKEALAKHGLDLEERLNGKKRIEWLTHGKERAINDFAHCSVVFCIGTIHLSDMSYLTQAVGQLRNPTQLVSAEERTSLAKSQHACNLVQAFCRGQSRVVTDGVANKATLYYLYKDNSLEPYLKEAMPEVHLRTYRTKHLKGQTQKDLWVGTLCNYLMLATTDKVTMKELTANVEGWAEVDKSLKTEVYKGINAIEAFSWIKRGHSFHRR